MQLVRTTSQGDIQYSQPHCGRKQAAYCTYSQGGIQPATLWQEASSILYIQSGRHTASHTVAGSKQHTVHTVRAAYSQPHCGRKQAAYCTYSQGSIQYSHTVAGSKQHTVHTVRAAYSTASHTVAGSKQHTVHTFVLSSASLQLQYHVNVYGCAVVTY